MACQRKLLITIDYVTQTARRINTKVLSNYQVMEY